MLNLNFWIFIYYRKRSRCSTQTLVLFIVTYEKISSKFSLFLSNQKKIPKLNFNFVLVPDPPSGLSVQVRNGKSAIISWNPPAHGSFTSFKLKINPLVHIPDPKTQSFTIDNVDGTQYRVNDLVPGATYQVQAFTVFENKESAAYTSRNFTTSKP